MNAAHREVRDGVRYSRGGAKFGVYPRAWAAMLAGRMGLGDLRGVDAVIDTQNGIPFFARLVSGAPTVLLTHHCHREQWPVAALSSDGSVGSSSPEWPRASTAAHLM